MSKKKTVTSQSRSKLEVLTNEALRADKSASMAKDKARAAKARLKAAKKEFKLAKSALKDAKKSARKTGKEAKRLQKALQTRLDRIASHRMRQKRRASAKKQSPAKLVKRAVEVATAEAVSVLPSAGNSA